MKLRPTFSIALPSPADEAIERLRETLIRHPSGPAVSTGHCAELSVDSRQRRIWSPHLSLQIEPLEDGSILNGRFSPRPDVWTLLMFLYFTILTLVFFGAMLGFAQWMISQTAWGFLAVVVGLPLIGSLHIGSLIGQRLGREQMAELRSRLDAALQTTFGIDSSDA